ncbi:unnamed protein product [Prunus brigantina]
MFRIKKTFNLRGMISELKSSLTEKDSELSSSAIDLVSRKDAYFCLDRKNADISLSDDKLLARLLAYHNGQGNDVNMERTEEQDASDEMVQRRTQLMRWWQMSWTRQVELLKAWLIRWMPKRLQIRGAGVLE